MTHGYSPRSNTKGRRGHKIADETDDQVEPEGDSGIVDPRPTGTNSVSDTSKTPHHSPAPTHGSADQTTGDGHQRHLRSSTTVTPTSCVISTAAGLRRPETWEDIQAAREREDARLYAEAVRIRREQLVRGYEEELHGLRARIGVLRQECEARVERATRKWEMKLKYQRGEIAMVVDDPSLPLPGVRPRRNSVRWQEDERGEMEMAVDQNYATQRQQPQQPHMGPPRTFPLSGEAHPGSTSSRPHHPLARPQPLRRQPAQLLMAIHATDASSSHSLDTQ